MAIRLDITTGRSDQEVKKLTKSLDGYTKEAKEASKGAESLRQEQDKFVKQAPAVNRQAVQLGKSFSGLSAALSGLAVGALIRKTTQDFVDLDKGLIGVSKTTNITGKALDDMGKRITQLSKEVPTSRNELLSIAQAAGQLGVQGSDNILKFTKTVAQLGTASDLAGEEAATTLARMLTVAGETADQVDVLGSAVVALGNNMAATESEIARVALQVGQATAEFGVSSTQAAAFGAALRSIGVQAELGGSAVGRTFRAIRDSIESGGEAFKELQRVTGETGDQLTQTFATDATSVFLSFVEGLGDVIKQGGSASAALEKFGLKGEEILKVIPTIALRNEELAKALRIAAEEQEHATALTTEAEAASKSYDAQLKILDNRLTDVSSTIGEELIPVVVSLTEGFTDFLENNREGLRDFAEKAGNAVETVGELANEAFEGFSKLPDVIKETGVIAAVLFGKRGVAVLGAGSILLDRFDNIKEAIKLLHNDQIGFFDFAFSNGEELEKLLAGLNERQKIVNEAEALRAKAQREFYVDDKKQLIEEAMALEQRLTTFETEEAYKRRAIAEEEVDSAIKDRIKAVTAAAEAEAKAKEEADEKAKAKADAKRKQDTEKAKQAQKEKDKIEKARTRLFVKLSKERDDEQKRFYTNASEYASTEYKKWKSVQQLRLKFGNNAVEERRRQLQREVEAAREAGVSETDIARYEAEQRVEIAKQEAINKQNEATSFTEFFKAKLSEQTAWFKDQNEVQKWAYNQMWDDITDITDTAAAGVSSSVSNLLFDVMRGDMKSLGDYWDSFWGSLLKTMTDKVAEMAVTWAASKVISFGSNFADSLLTFHTGTTGIKEDELLAILQEGEIVIPRKQSEQIKKFVGTKDNPKSGKGASGFFDSVTGMVEAGARRSDTHPDFGPANPDLAGAFMGSALAGLGAGAVAAASNYYGVKSQADVLSNLGYNLDSDKVSSLAKDQAISGFLSSAFSGFVGSMIGTIGSEALGVSDLAPWASALNTALSVLSGVSLPGAVLGALTPVTALAISSIADVMGLRENETIRDHLEDTYGFFAGRRAYKGALDTLTDIGATVSAPETYAHNLPNQKNVPPSLWGHYFGYGLSLGTIASPDEKFGAYTEDGKLDVSSLGIKGAMGTIDSSLSGESLANQLGALAGQYGNKSISDVVDAMNALDQAAKSLSNLGLDKNSIANRMSASILGEAAKTGWGQGGKGNGNSGGHGGPSGALGSGAGRQGGGWGGENGGGFGRADGGIIDRVLAVNPRDDGLVPMQLGEGVISRRGMETLDEINRGETQGIGSPQQIVIQIVTESGAQLQRHVIDTIRDASERRQAVIHADGIYGGV